LLLIVAALDDRQLRALRELTEAELGMDALVEVHTSAELQRALACGAKLIGVNNRDLGTFTVSLETSEQLASAAPAGTVLISESGLRNRRDIDRLREAGFAAFLIGESLMLARDPGAALRHLIAQEDQRPS
jgi:indole-3-glycerol phosphate synthase